MSYFWKIICASLSRPKHFLTYSNILILSEVKNLAARYLGIVRKPIENESHDMNPIVVNVNTLLGFN